MALPKKHRRLVAIAKKLSVLLVILLAAVVFIHIQNYTIAVEEQQVYLDTLPPAFDGLRVTVVSDLHGRQYGGGSRRLIALVAEQKPDIIAITGDLVDDVKQLSMVAPLVSGLAKVAPVYFVNGNHEWAAKAVDQLKEIFSGIDNLTMLQNRSVLLKKGGAQIVLFGIEDPNGPADMKGMRELVTEIRASAGEDAFILMLSHRNDRIGEADRCGVNLVLAGHAHGGLIRLPYVGGLIGPGGDWLPSYTDGLYVQGDTSMVVGRGLGNAKGTWRLFNRPQLLTVVLKYEAPIGE